MWMIKRLKAHGASIDDLITVYTKQIRCVLEFGVPVWNSSITKDESLDIERVQKAFLHIALQDQYSDYNTALKTTSLDSLEKRRLNLCITFAKRTAKHEKHKHWFEKATFKNTRSKKPIYKTPFCRLERYRNSPIPYLTRLLNSQ